MDLPKIKQVTGRAVHVPGDDIDTDRIIPARFMKCVTFDGLGEYAFYDARRDGDGNLKPEHPLNQERFQGASILLSGSNFGCGSSREHAPQAIYRAGFRGIIAESYAEIFFGNSIQLSIPCVTASAEAIAELAQAVAAEPQLAVTIDIEAQQVHYGSTCFDIEIRPGARDSLLSGKWDPLQDLIDGKNDVAQVVAQLSYV